MRLEQLLLLESHPILGLAREPLSGSVGLLLANALGLLPEAPLDVEFQSLLLLG